MLHDCFISLRSAHLRAYQAGPPFHDVAGQLARGGTRQSSNDRFICLGSARLRVFGLCSESLARALHRVGGIECVVVRLRVLKAWPKNLHVR